MGLIAIGVSGGIGAYKAVEIARLLQKQGHDVRAIMTRSARRFVAPLTFEAITRHPVITGQFAPGMNANIEHIDLASTIDLLLVAPATANVIGKFAHGISDDFLSALYLATGAPVLLAPAMNTNMWEHPAVVDNVRVLTARGVSFVDPGDGYLACGWVGKGRLAEPEDVAAAALRMLDARLGARGAPAATIGRGALDGRRVLVTAGPTIEDIDAVRFVGNRSSGRMGFAIAAAAAARGAEVTVVAGPTPVEPPAGVSIVRVRSAAEMHEAVMTRADATDVVIMAAAVADYTPAGGAAAGKIEKGGPLQMTFERTKDILADLGIARGAAARPVLVGFAAQTGHPVAAARRKLVDKRVDLIVANDVTASGAGFDVDTNQITIVSTGTDEALPLMSKRNAADAVLDRVERLLAAAPAAQAAR